MSAVTMAKSQEKKSQNYFLMTMIITMWLVKNSGNRILKRWLLRLTQEKMMGFDYCEENVRSTSNKMLLR